jgi:hypothetical protein
MKKLTLSVGKFFTTIWNKISSFYVYKVSVVFEKIGHALVHNFIIRIVGLKLIIFGFIKIDITRKRREAFYGYMFILLWILGYLVFTLYPTFYSLYLSMHEAYYNLEDAMKVKTGKPTAILAMQALLWLESREKSN